MSSYPVLCPSIKITSANNSLRINRGGTVETCAVAVGTYSAGESGTLQAALATAIDLHSLLSGTTVTVSRNVDRSSAVGGCTVAIVSSASWFFDVASSLHTFDMSLIGMSQTVNASTAATQNSTTFVGCCWVSSECARSDDGQPVSRKIINELAGGSSSLYSTGATQHDIELQISLLEATRIWTNANRSTYHPAFKRVIDGSALEYHEATLSSGTTLAALSSSTRVGGTYRARDVDRPSRDGDGVQMWSTGFYLKSEDAQ
jgi:hypothetical protein